MPCCVHELTVEVSHVKHALFAELSTQVKMAMTTMLICVR